MYCSLQEEEKLNFPQKWEGEGFFECISKSLIILTDWYGQQELLSLYLCYGKIKCLKKLWMALQREKLFQHWGASQYNMMFLWSIIGVRHT
jgi:hypothetical protein